MAVVAGVVRLHGGGLGLPGGVGPIEAQVGVAGHGVGIFRPVLELRALVLFASHASHCQACQRRERAEKGEWAGLLAGYRRETRED